MTTLFVYILAGIGFAWFLPGTWWQRGLLLIGWPIGTAWSMLVSFIDWWNAHGYQWPKDDE